MSGVKIVVGLGNPGREYAGTRHNVGFMVVDALSRRLNANERRTRFRAEVTEALADGEKMILVKPQTFMNLSGTSVREATRWYKTTSDDLLIVADDIDLPFGTLRLRATGGSGGHNGLKSIFADLGAQDIARLKIGVGRGSGQATRQVLTRFNAAEEQEVPTIIRFAVDCVLDWQQHGIIEAMNRCNRRLETTADPGEAPAGASSTGNTPTAAPVSDRDPAATSVTGAYNRARAWWAKHGSGSGESRGDRDP